MNCARTPYMWSLRNDKEMPRVNVVEYSYHYKYSVSALCDILPTVLIDSKEGNFINYDNFNSR